MKSRQLFFRLIISCAVVVAFLVSVGFASHKQSVMPCSAVNIRILDSSGTGFVEDSDIREAIQNKFGLLEGKPVSSINISLLENIINENPFIYDAEVFSTVDGKINIEVKQRIPVLRVMNYKNENFYIDKEGVFMPLSEKFTARVPLANGFIYDRETEKKVNLPVKNQPVDSSVSNSKIQQLFNIICYTNKNEFWKADVEQLYVNADGDIEMIPRVGNHSVVLGDDRDLDEKFSKLLIIYRERLNKRGWDKYSVINLKFKNQVVCIKK